MIVRWENLRMRKTAIAPYHWNDEMVAEQYGGNPEDWQIKVC